MVFTATAKYFHSAWFRAFAGKVAAAAMFLVPPLLIQAQDLPGQDDYSLAAGDSVLVRVYGEDDLTMELDVPAGGRVDYAFVGEFELSGKSVRAVQREIHERLLYRSFYVYGEVASPGGYAWEPGLTVRKVITLAGGLKERASGSKWYLVPEDGSEADRRRVSEDDPVGPGDTLTIEQSFF
jgi:polysaccharide export outer membrane protein